MKNYILFLIIGLLVVNTSCDSWLEETPVSYTHLTLPTNSRV